MYCGYIRYCHWEKVGRTQRPHIVFLQCFFVCESNCCCCSVAKSCLTLCDPMDCGTPGFAVLHHLPEFAQTHVHWVSDAVQPSHPLLLTLILSSSCVTPFSSCPQSFPASGSFPVIQFFDQVARVLDFTFSPSSEYSGLISFRIDWFDLLAVQGTLKSLLQHIVRKHQFFGTQLSLWSNSHIQTWLLEKP